jgi:uncharacterized protein (DUF362 family)
MNKTRTTARREFLKNALAGVSAFGLGAGAELAAASDAGGGQGKSRVVIARDAQLRGSGSLVDPGRVADLLDRAMQALFDRDHAVEAWKKLVRPGDAVGLKVNTLGGRGIATNRELVEAICDRLQEAGIKAAEIVVWDRDTSELERGGFHPAIGGERVQCFGTDRVDYEDDLSAWGSVGSRLSKILTQRTNVLISLPVLKDHDGAGVTLGLKNMYGVIHNPNKYHPNGCNPYVADVNMLPEIRQRLRLTICDVTTAMYDGGPAYKPERCWPFNGLIISQDPVALDYTGWQIIERKRAEKGMKTLKAEEREPSYIATAADKDHRLGTCDPRRIETVEI